MLFAEHFVAAYQHVGDFTISGVPGLEPLKLGGNVASYFCTPDGNLIHAVLGPAPADVLLTQAQWAIGSYAEVADRDLHRQRRIMSRQHAAASRAPQHLSGNREQVPRIHSYLASKPLVPLTEAYKHIFERLLNEPVNLTVETTEQIAAAMESARVGPARLLLVVHGDESNPRQVRRKWWQLLSPSRHEKDGLAALSKQYVIAVVPRELLEVVRARANMPPGLFEEGGDPLFVVVGGMDGHWQTVAGWNADELRGALAECLVSSLHRRRPSTTQHRLLQTLVGWNKEATRRLDNL